MIEISGDRHEARYSDRIGERVGNLVLLSINREKGSSAFEVGTPPARADSRNQSLDAGAGGNMSIKIFDCEQGTPEWYLARLGLPTSSEFATVLSPKAGKEGKTRQTYMRKLAGEIITGEPMEKFSNAYTDRGHALEDEARKLYAFATDTDPINVGFIRNGAKGCSPDSLIGDSGMLELKTKSAHLLIDILLADKFPSEHVAQCQGALWVAEREWIDIGCYCPGMPLFIKRATRDEAYIAQLVTAVDEFNDELAALVERVRAYGQVVAA